MHQGRCGRVWKISPPPGFDSRTVHPVASRYTDYSIPAPVIVYDGNCDRWSVTQRYGTGKSSGEEVVFTRVFLLS